MIPEKPESDAGRSAGILVVDDTPANLQVLAGMLKDRGYKVRPVPGGKLALLAARRDPPDLILLDINMPEMNGYEVCEHLKSDESLKGIPVIFISALTDQLDKVKAFATGGVDYITKPFQMEELHARVETHLKLRRLQIELEASNARLAKANGRMSRDLKAAARIQETFLPRAAPRVPGTEFAWIFRPCDELAGDGLNIIPLGDGKVGLYILDVSGHGVASALLSVTLSRLLSPPSEPSSILIAGRRPSGRVRHHAARRGRRRLNRLFPFDTATEQFATMVYGILDVATGEFRYVSAGHPGPVHLPSGAEPVILESRGPRSAWPTTPTRSGRSAWGRETVCTSTPTASPRRWTPPGGSSATPGSWRRSAEGGPSRSRRVSLPSWRRSRGGSDPRDLETISRSWRSRFLPFERPVLRTDASSPGTAFEDVSPAREGVPRDCSSSGPSSWSRPDLRERPPEAVVLDGLDEVRGRVRAVSEPSPRPSPPRGSRAKSGVNVLPLPDSLTTDNSPPIRTAIRLATARPRP